MRTAVVLLFILAIVRAADIDWSKVRPLPLPASAHQPPSRPNNGKNSGVEPRIVGGQYAYPHQFPYQAGLIITFPDFNAFCGGSVISNKYILTAAHCADGATSIRVILGAHNIQEDEPTQKEYIVPQANIKVHELWDPNRIINDLALLHIPEGIELVPGIIELVKLPGWSDQGNQYIWKPTTTSGWGKTSDLSTTISPILKFADSWVISPLSCGLRYPGSIQESHICMDSTLKSTCNGDSGGPLVTVVDGVPIQIGCTSFGLRFCSLTWPSVFTRITYFLKWIDDNTQHSIIGN